MKKPQLLRQHLVAAMPSLAADPERLLVFVDDGGLVASFTAGLSFQYTYTLELVLRDFTGAPEAVMVPLLQWLTRHQPELLANPANRDKLTFVVDVLSDTLVDLAIKLPLTERVRVVQDDAGAFQLEYLPEPPTEWEHRHSLAGGPLFADGEVVATLPAIVE
ncbi:TPA: phage tail protein [Stenotrophomonas maltophilia]|uniref:phage tail protein n=1 Tax=Stenotrophomonas maltophilia TaxID=40324 RepID=UPI000B4E5BB9|nr:phage tail protein [Stenotrophomonas maltophilia]OWQ59307.1 phage tail protein [Stenotrophomonas maltophilia]HEL3831916.1 phage tail protein [Stenotrophomonas maltophilia]HEL4225978.1 phage tail protein [Stenotrophomonas maltophilia]HEL4831211.1 phage tail protein [Stenotrophomonas maltophilia]